MDLKLLSGVGALFLGLALLGSGGCKKIIDEPVSPISTGPPLSDGTPTLQATRTPTAVPPASTPTYNPPTSTPTNTPWPAFAATSTLTPTRTGTASASPTSIPISSPSPIPTITLTAPPPSATWTPSATIVIVVNTHTPTSSPTLTPTSTLFINPTASVTLTPAASTTPDPAASPSSNATATSSATGTASSTSAGTPTAYASPTPSATPNPGLLNCSWTEATASGAMGQRMASGCVVFNNKMWLLSGGTDCSISGSAFPDIWSSSDGVSWTRANAATAFGVRWTPGVVVFQNKMWIIGGLSTGGLKNDVWNSTDGVNWTQVAASTPFSAREGFGCVVFNDKIWVVCGDNTGGLAGLSDVWSSPDGVNWTLAGNFPSARTGLACVAYNGAIWVISGGWAEPDPAAGSGMYMVDSFNDSWYSTDGANWTEANANAGFSPRVYASAQVYNNQIWLVGGVDTSYIPTVSQSGIYRDAWVSNNGANWSETCASLSFSARFSAESYVFNNELWIVGGCSANGSTAAYDSDVWHHP